jgi:hypothetical protein
VTNLNQDLTHTGLKEGFEMQALEWDYTIMKLVADDNGRLACKSLFTPKKAFSAERQADGEHPGG